jgi:hypothetical protein
VAYPDDLNYSAGQRLELSEAIYVAVKALLVEADRTNQSYQDIGRQALKTAIAAAITAALPPAA